MVIYQDLFFDCFHERFNNELAVLWPGYLIFFKTFEHCGYITEPGLWWLSESWLGILRTALITTGYLFLLLITHLYNNTLVTHKAFQLFEFILGIIGLAYQGKDIVFRFIIEYKLLYSYIAYGNESFLYRELLVLLSDPAATNHIIQFSPFEAIQSNEPQL
jgi:hypothetical protein